MTVRPNETTVKKRETQMSTKKYVDTVVRVKSGFAKGYAVNYVADITKEFAKYEIPVEYFANFSLATSTHIPLSRGREVPFLKIVKPLHKHAKATGNIHIDSFFKTIHAEPLTITYVTGGGQIEFTEEVEDGIGTEFSARFRTLDNKTVKIVSNVRINPANISLVLKKADEIQHKFFVKMTKDLKAGRKTAVPVSRVRVTKKAVK